MASAAPSPVYKVILAGKRGVGKSTLYDYLVRNMEPGGGTHTTSCSLPESTAGDWDKWLFNVPGPRRAKKIKVSKLLNHTSTHISCSSGCYARLSIRSQQGNIIYRPAHFYLIVPKYVPLPNAVIEAFGKHSRNLAVSSYQQPIFLCFYSCVLLILRPPALIFSHFQDEK